MDILLLLIGLTILAGLGGLIYLKSRLYLAQLNDHQSDTSPPGNSKAKPPKKLTLNPDKSTLLIRVFVIVMISILAILPQDLIMEMAQDRSHLYRGVVNEIGQTWGGQQTVAGPALIIPYSYEHLVETSDREGSRQVKRHIQDQLIILPKELDLNIGLAHGFRHRGIYQSLVYKSQIQGKAQFNPQNIANKKLSGITSTQANSLRFDLDNARVIFGISANQGIERIEQLEITGSGVQLRGSLVSGTGLQNKHLTNSAGSGFESGLSSSFSSGFHQGVKLNKKNQITVEFAFNIRGSEAIDFLPLGEQTQIKMQSDWPHPSFHSLLPLERNIDNTGFNALWQISHLNRNYPQQFSASEQVKLNVKSAAVNLFEPISHYAKIERAVKYGLLFIGLTFIMLFILELSQSQKLSLIQYLLVASAMSLFYLLLLSLAEHTSFAMAYMIAASVPIVSISTYIGSATGSKQAASIIFALLVSLYALLYSILKLEDYALLMGTGLILTVLLTLMYLTRGANHD